MNKPARKIVDAAARLAVFALSSHEALVRSGDHVSQLPPQIVDMAIALGVEPTTLLARGYALVGVRGGK